MEAKSCIWNQPHLGCETLQSCLGRFIQAGKALIREPKFCILGLRADPGLVRKVETQVHRVGVAPSGNGSLGLLSSTPTPLPFPLVPLCHPNALYKEKNRNYTMDKCIYS